MKTTPHQIGVSALLLRLALGVIFVGHGAFKFLVLGLPATAQFFADHGFPAWTASPVAVAEVLGGLMLVFGWRARWASVALVPVALGAVLVHGPNGWYFGAPHGGWEYPAFLSVALVAQAFLGDGLFALSSLLRGRAPSRARGQNPADDLGGLVTRKATGRATAHD